MNYMADMKYFLACRDLYNVGPNVFPIVFSSFHRLCRKLDVLLIGFKYLVYDCWSLASYHIAWSIKASIKELFKSSMERNMLSSDYMQHTKFRCVFWIGRFSILNSLHAKRSSNPMLLVHLKRTLRLLLVSMQCECRRQIVFKEMVVWQISQRNEYRPVNLKTNQFCCNVICDMLHCNTYFCRKQ